MNQTGMTYKERMAALKCAVVIPTYNNAGTIAQVIADVKAYTNDVIVVNDGSTDKTAEILASISDIRVIDYPKNQGKGYALRLALNRAYECGFHYAITIDSDGQHYADDIPTFIDKIEEKPESLLVGARNLTAENMPSKNTFANKFSNFWYKVETGQELTDTQSGYRLYPLEKLHHISLITRRYEFEVEIIVRAAWRGINVENIPIKVYYPPVEERVSHFRPLQDFTRISMLNIVLVAYALLLYYPWRFVRSLKPSTVKKFFYQNVIKSKESNLRMAAAMGWGVFCAIIPIWGYQMVFAGVSAHVMRLNKVVAIVFSQVSIPPLIPFIIYASVVLGEWMLKLDTVKYVDNLYMEYVGKSLGQYVIGSFLLGAIACVATFLLSFIIMSICRRNTTANE